MSEKQVFHSLFWHRGKVGLPLEGEAKQPSSQHSHCGTICLFFRGEANASFFAVSFYGLLTYAYGASSSSHSSSLASSLLLSSSSSPSTCPAKFVSKLTFSREDIAAADQLEPALESLLRSAESS